MGKSDLLYTMCVLLFPLAFAGVVVGFGCPVWKADSLTNSGLWQNCSRVFISCSRLDFDSGQDWMIGVRAVEIFAIVMVVVAAAVLLHEICFRNSSRRRAAKRIAAGVLCILEGSGGLAGIIVYAVKTDDEVSKSNVEFGWAMMLVAAASGLALLLGTGMFVSGACEDSPEDSDKVPINAYGPGTPYLPTPSQSGESYEMTAHSNTALVNEGGGDAFIRPAIFSGLPRSTVSNYHEPYPYSGVWPPAASEPRRPHYYSSNGAEGPYHQLDLSEGFLPVSRARTSPHSMESPYYAEGLYQSGRPSELASRDQGEGPYYARGGRRMEEGFSGGGRGEWRGYDDRRENLYRSNHF